MHWTLRRCWLLLNVSFACCRVEYDVDAGKPDARKVVVMCLCLIGMQMWLKLRFKCFQNNVIVREAVTFNESATFLL